MSSAGHVLDMINRMKSNRNMMRSGKAFKNVDRKFKSSGKKFALRTPTPEELRISNEKNRAFISRQKRQRWLVFLVSCLITFVLLFLLFKGNF